MKTHVLISLLLTSTVSTALAQSNKTSTVSVQDVLSAIVPAPDPSKHKNHDAEIYRTARPESGTGYEVVYYQEENGKLHYHKAFYGSQEIMKRADYSWTKDTITVRVYNSTDKKAIKFRAYGWGGTSNLMTDE